VLSVAAFGAGFRRLLHLFVVTAAALVVAAPLLLGPALVAALHAVGASVAHRCACGMQPGRCGCPECEAIEAEHRQDRESSVAVVRSSCDDEGLLPGARALPPALLATAPGPSDPPSARAFEPPSAPDAPSWVSVPPPTPPPRRHGASFA
jgi:hypothetical protein